MTGGSLELRWRAGPGVVIGERSGLSQALDNLIVNAIEHGGPSIVVEAAPGRGDRLRISVDRLRSRRRARESRRDTPGRRDRPALRAASPRPRALPWSAGSPPLTGAASTCAAPSRARSRLLELPLAAGGAELAA